jgi:hypothetical protein
MLSVITVAIPSISTTAERGIEMFNIAAAATLTELGRRIRRICFPSGNLLNHTDQLHFKAWLSFSNTL